MEERPLFGRYEKLALFLLGFIFTTVGGALLGNYLQRQSRYKVQQEQVFSEVAQRFDRRAHQTQLLLYALQEDTTYGSAETRWPLYTAMLEDWNVNRNRTSALVQRYFGREAARCYKLMNDSFVNINYSVRRGVEPDSILSDLQRLQPAIRQFDMYLLKRMSTLGSPRSGPCEVPLVDARPRTAISSDNL